MYFGQQYTRKHRAAIEAWAEGVSDVYLPPWYHMWRWYENGCENSESSLELYGADFGHEERKQEFQARTRQYPPVLSQYLDEKLEIRVRDWTAYRGIDAASGDWAGAKREAVSGGGDEESELGREAAVSGIDDEEARRESCRFLHLEGEPGSGKSAVMLEASIRAATAGVVVSIVCPTGTLVHAVKAKLPEIDGIENSSFSLPSQV
jgi:hypothetical protein